MLRGSLLAPNLLPGHPPARPRLPPGAPGSLLTHTPPPARSGLWIPPHSLLPPLLGLTHTERTNREPSPSACSVPHDQGCLWLRTPLRESPSGTEMPLVTSSHGGWGRNWSSLHQRLTRTILDATGPMTVREPTGPITSPLSGLQVGLGWCRTWGLREARAQRGDLLSLPPPPHSHTPHSAPSPTSGHAPCLCFASIPSLLPHNSQWGKAYYYPIFFRE